MLRPPQGHGRLDSAGEEDTRPFHSVATKSFGLTSKVAAQAAKRRLPPHKYLSQTRRNGGETKLKPRVAAGGDTAPRGPEVRPRSPPETPLARLRGGRRTDRRGSPGDVSGGARCLSYLPMRRGPQRRFPDRCT